MPVSVSFDYPPIPIRSVDWSACIDGQEEDGRNASYVRGLQAALRTVQGVI